MCVRVCGCVCTCLWSVNYYYNTFFDGLVLELFSFGYCSN